MSFLEFSANQIRVAVDLRQTYEAYREARRNLAGYAGGMHWKQSGQHEYLVKTINRRGAMKGLGLRSPETEAIFAEFTAGKARAQEREAALGKALREMAGMARSVGINRVPSIVAAALRRLDEYGLLGRNVMVVGTNAMYGYESVAGVMFDAGLLATTDVDLLWDARSTLKLALLDQDVLAAGVLAILRKVDRSFQPTRANSFRAVNKDGFFVDMIKAMPNPPWKYGEKAHLAAGDLTPTEIPNLKWLLSAEKFASVVIGHDGLPAPMVSPDPRAFAVYKRWLAEQPDREPDKKKRDTLQAEATIALVRAKFPQLRLDANAERMFPAAVRSIGGDTGYAL